MDVIIGLDTPAKGDPSLFLQKIACHAEVREGSKDTMPCHAYSLRMTTAELLWMSAEASPAHMFHTWRLPSDQRE
jgi:hypothetical protein